MSIDWEIYVPKLTFILCTLAVVSVLALIAPRITLLLSKLAPEESFGCELIKQLKRPIQFLLPLIGLQIIWHSPANTIIFKNSVSHLISLSIIAVITWMGVQTINAGRAIIVRRHPITMKDNRIARRIHTQTQVLDNILSCIIILLGIAAMLMTFPGGRQMGASLLASAGLAGIAVGFAAKPVLGNLIAGLQIAITHPISIDDVVIVENESGRVEEISSTYVIIKLWDERRMIVPLQYFIENPFQNWTLESSQLLSPFFIWVDYAMPLAPLREEVDRLCKEVPDLWDGRVGVVQVTDSNERAMQLRILVSASDSGKSWDLRCFLRERLIEFITRQYPHYLPRYRTDELHSAELEKPNTTAPTNADIN